MAPRFDLKRLAGTGGSWNYGVMPPAPGASNREEMLREVVRRGLNVPMRQRPPVSVFDSAFSILGDPARGIDAAPPHPSYLGQSKLIALLGDFPGTGPNHQFSTTYSTGARQYFQDLLFGTMNPAGEPWTLRNYYYDSSYGALTLTGDVFGPYTVSHDYSYYTGGGAPNGNYGFGSYPANAAGYAVEVLALHQAANPGFDWTPYDADQNGVVDGVFFIHPGNGAEFGAGSSNTGKFWSHFHSMTGAGVPNAPVQVGGGEAVDPYSCDPEYEYWVQDQMVGVFAHEVMHNFGMTDVYNRQSTCEGGAGDWSAQSGGSWLGNPGGSRPCLVDPWNASLVGWVNPRTPVKNAPLSWLAPRMWDPMLTPTGTPYPVAYKLWTNGQAQGEYFLVENRVRRGWDQFIPGPTGTPAAQSLIWHIDEAVYVVGLWNDDCDHPFNAVEEADAGNNKYARGMTGGNGHNMRMKPTPPNQPNGGDLYDAFPANGNVPAPWTNTEFSKSSHPSSRSYYAGDDTYVKVNNFRRVGVDMQLDVYVEGPPKAVDTDPSKFRMWPEPFHPNRARGRTLHFGPVPKGSWMNVFSVSGERVATLVAQHDGINHWVDPRLSRGVYLFLVTTPFGKSVRGTFAILTE